METKGMSPVSFLEGQKPATFVKFYFEVAQLKQLFRQGWLQKGVARQHCESVAEHVFSMNIFAMVIADNYFPELNKETVMRMCLIHDIAEVYTGDYTPSDQKSKKEKVQEEAAAIEKIFAQFPNKNLYLDLWKEYQERASAEARFVKCMDLLDMYMQASIYEYLEEKDFQEFMSSVEDISCPHIRGIFEDLSMIRRDINQRK